MISDLLGHDFLLNGFLTYKRLQIFLGKEANLR